MKPELNRIYIGDCVETMRSWPDNCVDSVVTDPPYGIRFMGKAWDGADIDATIERKKRKDSVRSDGFKRNDGVAFASGTYNLAPEAMRNFQLWTAAWAVQAFRVLKPGGHLLAFASTRTYHRMACGVEDAGFDVRDQVAWIYGSGFPKSLNISKAIDRSNGDQRPIIGKSKNGVGNTSKSLHKADGFAVSRSKEFSVTSAASAASAAWDGWGTALKPAMEPVVIARKPISEKTVAANVLRWGTGALNIDGTRIEAHDDQLQEKYDSVQKAGPRENSIYGSDARSRMGSAPHESGRWPANVLLDQYAAGLLDSKNADASRFFYVAKPDSAERNMGMHQDDPVPGGEATGRKEGSAGLKSPRAGAGGKNQNFHPTVKPVDIMVHLIKLVTPPGGVVLDPFLGSGTTAIAAARLGHTWIGCEMAAEYSALAEKRIAHETAQGKFL